MAAFPERVKNQAPLIHNITNYVTVNDCANILLACGGSPIMADDLQEAEEITSLCAGLNINIGTLNQRTIPAMLAAGKKANACGHPVLLDPVGAGASRLRTETAEKLLKEVRFTAIRGNISEIKALALGMGTTRGVDADGMDAVTDDTLDAAAAFTGAFARKTGAVVAVTGAVDMVTDGSDMYVIRNGHPMMRKVTGTGCMLSAMITAYLAANPGCPLDAVAAAVCAMGICGERAFSRLTPEEGNAAYRNYIIDAVYHMDGKTLEKGAEFRKYRLEADGTMALSKGEQP
ncbi:MAG: hydroxyethylthiazole kinase [Eisenbergiella sp.]|uniref:hydroxyethylthiazole kinase n=1 Tax=unclassified Eisenbergiella TaxID=2652273 RepID=UPI000E470A3E|nr:MULTISPECIES: hydroxyethylthiazole kinase [unclassified Eisenbergiella]MBS5535647.1 hydroxyethylthiazole kinase [Lachnospiraceae bacterium]RHP85737.1 hydroxyethylthiazole kinase [Eisenbergiella sp. OF01-20]